MKLVAIVADNYKLSKFKKELNKNGFTDFEIVPFVDNTSSIKINVPDEKVKEVGKICQLVEMHFKRSN